MGPDEKTDLSLYSLYFPRSVKKNLKNIPRYYFSFAISANIHSHILTKHVENSLYMQYIFFGRREEVEFVLFFEDTQYAYGL